MKVAVVKYNAGNIFSVVHALGRLGVEPLLTDCAEELRSADRVIFPGQGEASGAMRYLRERGLDKVITSLTQPVLGICIGQQLMCRHSEEGDVDCLGIFNADVKRFRPVRHEDKIPHMGWNSLTFHVEGQGARSKEQENTFCPNKPLAPRPLPLSPLFRGLGEEYVYFVHSYYVPVCEHTAAVTDYIHPFSAAMQKDNFYATQFHPEKSGAVGQQILRNFLNLPPQPFSQRDGETNGKW
ncbi:MAG: imidazole glycerol phosphate synthase subunit HisH [Bacteroidaceae bacterium]|nr:imidazole glycerol phosphate synthase subunit HisH [Bacteroidaceae bacterium]